MWIQCECILNVWMQCKCDVIVISMCECLVKFEECWRILPICKTSSLSSRSKNTIFHSFHYLVSQNELINTFTFNSRNSIVGRYLPRHLLQIWSEDLTKVRPRQPHYPVVIRWANRMKHHLRRDGPTMMRPQRTFWHVNAKRRRLRCTYCHQRLKFLSIG